MSNVEGFKKTRETKTFQQDIIYGRRFYWLQYSSLWITVLKFDKNEGTTTYSQYLKIQRQKVKLDKVKLDTDSYISMVASHSCAGAMLIFSVSFQFYQMSPKKLINMVELTKECLIFRKIKTTSIFNKNMFDIRRLEQDGKWASKSLEIRNIECPDTQKPQHLLQDTIWHWKVE